jgi:serine/threonine protein kinase
MPNSICCLNPDCSKPVNPPENKTCLNCGTPLRILRNRYHPVILLSDAGGFGRTYLAVDLDKLKEECVIKQLAPQVQGTQALKKATELFEQEARQLQELGEHPQIPQLLGYFEENGYLYLIQQYIRGKTLDKSANQGVWSELEVKDFLLNILPVLELIHSKNIIHRDLKPANIIKRDDNGNYVLIDFGAAKELATRIASRATQIGTYGYSAREQIIEGKAYPGSDLFSLGITCFYLLTKVEPGVLYIDEGYRWLDNWDLHLKQPLSKEFKEVLKQLLQKEMKNRFSSAHQVLKALQTPSAKEEIKQNKSTATSVQSVTPKPTVLSQQQVKSPPPPKAKVIPQSEKKVSNPQKLSRSSFLKWSLYGTAGLAGAFLLATIPRMFKSENELIVNEPIAAAPNQSQEEMYERLEQFLAQQDFRKADEQTWELMKQAGNGGKETYLREDQVNNFSCSALKKMDDLWVKYSQGKFGFSVQKDIWESVGGKISASETTYRGFTIKVGWEVEGEGYVEYETSNFSLGAIDGHLPRIDKWALDGICQEVRTGIWICGLDGFFWCIANCKV